MPIFFIPHLYSAHLFRDSVYNVKKTRIIGLPGNGKICTIKPNTSV